MAGAALNRTRHPDLLLVNPPSRRRVYQSLATELAAIEPPVWAGLMATYVRNCGFGVELLDADAEELSIEQTAQLAAEASPLLVAIVVYGHQPSASTQVMPAAGELCTALKSLQASLPILLVGGHVAALPERTLSEEAADFTCTGEGLVTLVELLEAVRGGATDFSGVSDLCYRDQGRPVRSSRRASLVTRLDELMPSVAFDLLPMSKYRAHNWHCLGEADGTGELARQPYAALYTTLGCPFRCSFCCIHAPFKSAEAALGMRATANSYRKWSPRVVVDTLELLATRHGVRNVKIADEMFVLDRAHVEAICDGIVERGLDLNLWAYARVDTLKDEMLPRLKRAGFNWLAFGIEAADEAVRKDVRKVFGQERIYSALQATWDAGLHVIGNYIFGLPGDDARSLAETLALATELNCEFGNFYCAMAYPGSELHDLALREGWDLPETWGAYSQHSFDSSPLRTRHLSSGEILRFRDSAFQRYHTSPRYLEMLERKFGPAAVRHVRSMTAHKLERKP